MSSVDTPSYFPLSTDSGGGEGDVPARENPQVLPPQERYLSGNEVTTGRIRGQTQQVQPPSARTRNEARSKATAIVFDLQNGGEALLTEAAGPGLMFEIATEIEHKNQRGACDDVGLATERTLYPGESDRDFRSPIGMPINRIESTPQNMAELRDSKYKEYWTRAINTELKGCASVATFSDENIPQEVKAISAKWVCAWKTDSSGFITKGKARLVARGFGQQPGVDYFETFAPTPAI